MAGVLNFRPTPVSRPLSTPRKSESRAPFRVSAEIQETPISPKLEVSSTSSPTLSPPSNFKPPQPKPFSVRPDKILDVLTASLALIFRLGTGVFVSGYSASFVSKSEIPPGEYALEIAGFKLKESSKLGPRPEKPIEIYEFESCPFCRKMILDEELMKLFASIELAVEWCDSSLLSHLKQCISQCKRKVREIVAVLDLDVLFYPCPRNGPNFRPKVAQMGGKQQFPYMVDPNTGVAMYESDDIIKYLVGKYGDGTVPLTLSLGLLTTLTEGFAMIGRLGRGSSYTNSKLPPKPLEIWAYEASPFCKIVREVLVELELPHILHSCARGSPKRQIVYQNAGHFQVPYLEDPNSGVKMFESAEIVEYLKATYALP